MRRRALLSTVGATALAGCGGLLGDDATESTTEPELTTEPSTAEESGTTAESESTRATTTDAESPLELTTHELVRSNEGSASELATATGTIENVTDDTIGEATVTATFADADGETLARASASASDLSPGQSWSFELVYPGTGEDARAVADYALAVEVGD